MRKWNRLFISSLLIIAIEVGLTSLFFCEGHQLLGEATITPSQRPPIMSVSVVAESTKSRCPNATGDVSEISKEDSLAIGDCGFCVYRGKTEIIDYYKIYGLLEYRGMPPKRVDRFQAAIELIDTLIVEMKTYDKDFDTSKIGKIKEIYKRSNVLYQILNISAPIYTEIGDVGVIQILTLNTKTCESWFIEMYGANVKTIEQMTGVTVKNFVSKAHSLEKGYSLDWIFPPIIPEFFKICKPPAEAPGSPGLRIPRDAHTEAITRDDTSFVSFIKELKNIINKSLDVKGVDREGLKKVEGIIDSAKKILDFYTFPDLSCFGVLTSNPDGKCYYIEVLSSMVGISTGYQNRMKSEFIDLGMELRKTRRVFPLWTEHGNAAFYQAFYGPFYLSCSDQND